MDASLTGNVKSPHVQFDSLNQMSPHFNQQGGIIEALKNNANFTKRNNEDLDDDYLSFLSSNGRINFQSQISELKSDINIPQTQGFFSKTRQKQQPSICEEQEFESTKKVSKQNTLPANTKLNEQNDNKEKIKNNKQQRRSLFVPNSSDIDIEDHNQVVLRSTIRKLTQRGVVLKDQKEQNTINEIKDKEESPKNDDNFLFATNLKDLIKLENGILEHEAFQIMKPSIINPLFVDKTSFRQTKNRTKEIIQENLDEDSQQVKEQPEESQKPPEQLHWKDNLKIFLKSKRYNTFFIALSLLNLLAFMVDDYSSRRPTGATENSNLRSTFAETIQFSCSFIFVSDIILQIIYRGFWKQKNAFFKNPWHLFNFFSVLSSVIVGFTGSLNAFSIILRVLGMLRPLKLIYHIKPYKKQLERFIRSVSLLGESIIRLFIFMVFFTILGLNIFKGSLEYRCRETPNPPENSEIWQVAEDVPFLCGYWACPGDTYCRSPYDYDLSYNKEEIDIPEMAYGFISFDNFFKALLTIIHITFIMNWSRITFTYWRYVNTLFVSAYFTSACIFLFHILINMILAIFYDSFQLQKGIKNFREYKLIIAQKQEQKNRVKLRNLENEMSKIMLEKENEKKKILEQKQQEKNNASQVKKKVLLIASIASKFKKIGSSQKNEISDAQQPNSNLQISVNNELNNAGEQQNQISSEEFEDPPLLVKIYMSFAYQFISQFYILISIIVITLDRYPISQAESDVYLIIQLCLNLLFIMEITFKVLLLQRDYFKSWLNVLDSIIVMVITSINIYYLVRLCEGLENPLESESLRGLQTAKSIEILRIFQLINYNPYLKTVQYLIEIFVQSIIKLSYYFLIIIAYCVLFALIGNYLFAFYAYFDANEEIAHDKSEGKSPRINYDSFLDSFEAIMLIILNDEWADQMYYYMRSLGQYVAIFWVIVVFTGTMLVMNLLRALFIKTYLKYLYNSNIGIHESVDKLQNAIKKFHKFGEVQTPLPQNDHPGIQNKFILRLSNYKLNIFQNKRYVLLMQYCSRIENSPYFINFLIFLTVANTALLAAQSRLDDPNSTKIKTLRALEMITMVIYFFEALIKIIARGFLLNGPNSYMRQFKNIYDLFLLITQIISLLVYPDYVIFRTLRTLNLFHLSKYFVGVRVMLVSLSQSVPTILRLLLFTFCILIVFAIIPMKQLKGKMYYCASLEREKLESIHSKQDCLDEGGDWLNNLQNWDNVLFSLFNLFIMASCEGWSILMGQANDARGVDLNPQQNQEKEWSVYFIIYFILGNIMLFNAFTGVMIEKYIEIKKKFALQQEIVHVKDATKLERQSTKIRFDLHQHIDAGDEVVEWMEIKKSIYDTRAPKVYSKPTKEQDYLRHYLYILINHKHYKMCMDTCIILSTICFALNYWRAPDLYEQILLNLNQLFLIIYIIEIGLKIYTEKFLFFASRFQIFELIMVSLSLVYLIMQGTLDMKDFKIHHREIVLCMEFISVFRVLRLAKTITIVKKTLNILFYILPEIAPVAGLLLYLIYMYALIGMQIFPFIKVQNTLNGYDQHFKTFNTAVFTLIRVASGEQWFYVVNDAVRQQQPNFVCQTISNYDDYINNGLNGCGTYWGYIYFFSFHLFVSVIILNLFIAVLLELIIGQNTAMSKYQLSKIKELWSEYDKQGYGFINYEDFWEFSFRIAMLYGVDEADISNPVQKKNFLKFLQLPLYTHTNKEGKSYFGFRFHDVVIQMTQVSLFLRFGILPGGPQEDPKRIEQFYQELDQKNKFVAHKSHLKSGDIAVIVIIQRRIKNWMERGKHLYKIKKENPAQYAEKLNEYHQSYRSLNINSIIKISQKDQEEDAQSIIKPHGKKQIFSNFSNIATARQTGEKSSEGESSQQDSDKQNESEGSSHFSEKQIQETPNLMSGLFESIQQHDFNKIYSNKFESISLKQKNIESSYKNFANVQNVKDSNINIINYYNITNNYYNSNFNLQKSSQSSQGQLDSLSSRPIKQTEQIDIPSEKIKKL
ncbi:cation channel family protein (macronuclear) [Tetrahymena thermophila SB210]|uniref:Cation channel family protein n=1 Tax=Tetrahymena thermophila (strain SB210) TaxID=312017 RepID=Q22N11_TETTS|nr:cation channel family protein [Tetrahymena thermophila SB210]EAR86385.2 cation channel family protein [Tetrahymena thermophila SB210]|eukprot:XP_976859.2 cation channel family protein [Tetrahymena thermophila SB210]